ncbi:hypothetical protein [Plebeiibacterium marinum]|uniref:DUF4292 domain-containing protein n=1 Tax=Plebeiibacterium marinum TaxID=2992111 RepID=A0AAE3MEI1_9BACT|nr:hypothetical protein [Plebeiobacterium marinum]MCW3806054.1 hypothetical protein [Plebeiobacterium marinum]
MKIYLTIFFLLSNLLCHSINISKEGQSTSSEIEQPLLRGHKTALYKAKMQVFGKVFSGLVLFKYNQSQKDYNIVLLTEVGITLCEFYCVDNNIVVKKASSLFQSKMAQKTLSEDFSYLIYNVGKVKKVANGKYKNLQKIRYTLDVDGELEQIRKRRLINGVIVNLEDYSKGVPSGIHFKHRGIKFDMKLSLLKVS